MEDGDGTASHQVSDGLATVGITFVMVASVFGNTVFEVGKELIPFSDYALKVYNLYTVVESNFQRTDIALGIVSESVRKVQGMHAIITHFMSDGSCVPATDQLCLQMTVDLLKEIADNLEEMNTEHEHELRKANGSRCFVQKAWDYSKYTIRAEGYVAKCSARMQELTAAVGLWTNQKVDAMIRRQEECHQQMLDLLGENQRRLEARNDELQAQLATTESAHQAQQLAADQQRVALEVQNAKLQAQLVATETAHQTQQLAADQQRVHLEAKNAQLQAELKMHSQAPAGVVIRGLRQSQTSRNGTYVKTGEKVNGVAAYQHIENADEWLCYNPRKSTGWCSQQRTKAPLRAGSALRASTRCHGRARRAGSNTVAVQATGLTPRASASGRCHKPLRRIYNRCTARHLPGSSSLDCRNNQAVTVPMSRQARR